MRAKAFYREAIGAEGGNPLASYALAELLYSEYEESPNKEAILSYQEALQSDAPELRSRAFRGLADAYCQTVHRHRRGGPESLEEAKRYAEFALEECQSQDNGKRSRSWFLEHAPWAQPQGSPQNRPTKVTSKPANEGGPGPGCFTATCRDRASLFWYANSVGHT